MNDNERKLLAEAAIPLESLCILIKMKYYKELTVDIQNQLLNSCDIIRKLLFGEYNEHKT